MRRPTHPLVLAGFSALLMAGTLIATGPVSQATPPTGKVDKEMVGKARHPSDTTSVVMRQGHDTWNYTATMAPGATSGWHRHPGDIIVLVKSGTLTVYGVDGPPCVGKDFPAGTVYFEDNAATAPYPMFAHNRGDVPLELVVVAFNVPPDGKPTYDADAPSDCPDPTE